MVFFKKYAILALFAVLLASLVNAAPFDVEIVPIENRINIDGFARFEIKIKNNLDVNDRYRIYNPSFPTWDLRTDPLVNPITLDLGPKEEGSVEVIVDPLKIRDIGTYGVGLNVRSRNSNELFSVPLKVTILSTEGLIGGYVPTIVASVGIPKKIDPREKIPIKIVLNNQNVIDYPELVIKLESELIKDTITTSLGAKEEKTLEVNAEVDRLTPPRTDTLAVTLFREDVRIGTPIVKKFEIVRYASKELVTQKKRLLLTQHHYELVSNDPQYSGTFKIETSLFESIFSSENPKAKIITENGKRYFVWDVELKNNRMEVVVTRNFLSLFVIIILLLALIATYFTLRSPLMMRKESSNIVKKEGGVSEMSLILHIKNRGNSKIHDLVITETIPSIVSVEREVSIGALQPSKVLRHDKKKTTVIKWNIDSLDASEERVLSYKIKTKLSIIGSFSLPGATAHFKANNKTFTSRSNRLNIEN